MAAAFHCLYFLPVRRSTEQALNCVPTGQRSKVTHNKFFALLQCRGPREVIKGQSDQNEQEKRKDREQERKKTKQRPCLLKEAEGL